MLKKITSCLIIAVMIFVAAGCFTQTHIVNKGAQGSSVTEARQWWILWGLVPLNEVDSKKMAGEVDNYTVVTESTFVDGVISIFTGIITVAPRTVRVIK